MAYEMNEAEKREYDAAIDKSIEKAGGKSSRLMQLATDATRFLSVVSNNLEQATQSGFFIRLRDLLPSRKTL